MVAGTIGLIGEGTGAALPSPTSANPARGAAGDLASAKKHYRDGQTKFQAGDFAGALADFEIANDVKATAQAQRYIGRCLDAMGQYPGAVEWYEKFLAHVPAKMRAQAERTRARVAEIRAAGARSGPGPGGQAGAGALGPSAADGSNRHPARSTEPAIVDIDTIDVHQTGGEDRETAATSAGATPVVPVSAGTPSVVTEAPRGSPSDPTTIGASTGVLRAGGSSGTPGDVLRIPPAAPRSADRRSRLPAYITAGAALAAAGVGTAFGIIALGDKATFDARSTPQNAATRNEHALMSDIAFGNAFALGGASLVLFVMGEGNPKQELEPTATALSKTVRAEAPPRAGSVTPAPLIGPHAGGAGLLVRF
ncbi:MAG TPA: tetratricopeptide repeat protein [Polyangiaceae bacterium]|nr:tetratricopeptide repeat protein [Polyangiaceae bacterium]